MKGHELIPDGQLQVGERPDSQVEKRRDIVGAIWASAWTPCTPQGAPFMKSLR